uniref:Uncharacterized protein n=1 Tax=Oryza glumipatula TaxID=40148 RepID=A0A0D9Y6G7_9ORYZ
MAVCNRQGVWLLDPFVSVDLHGGPLCAGSHDAALIPFPSSYAPVVKEAGNNSASLAFCRLLLYVITTNGMRLGAEADSGVAAAPWFRIGGYKENKEEEDRIRVPSSGLCTQELLARFSLHFSLNSIGDDEQPTTMEINYYYYKRKGACAPICAPLRCIVATTVRRGQDKRGANSRGWSRCAHLQRIVRMHVLMDMLTDLREICLCGYMVCGALGLLDLSYRDVLVDMWFSLHFSLSSIGDDEQPTTMEINYYYYKRKGACAPIASLWASLHYIVAMTVRRGHDRRGATRSGWSRCARLQKIMRRYVLVDIWFAVFWRCWSCSVDMWFEVLWSS